jgi:RHS repeat-associated protein
MGNGSFVTTGYAVTGFADINGDGKDDSYTVSAPQSPSFPSDSCVNVYLSRGDGSYLAGPPLPCTLTSLVNNPGFADINGDGIADFYDWASDGNIRVFLANSVMPDLITSVANGLGEQKQLAYASLTDGSVYVPALVQTYPYRAVNDHTYVVSVMRKSDGLGGLATTSYVYGGQMMHVTANERLGFGWIQRAEPDGSWVNDFYNLDVNRFGTLRESSTYVPGGTGGVMVKHTINNWQTGTSVYSRIMIRLFDITEETYELNGSLVTQTKTNTVYDGYGYPTSTVVTQLDGRKKTTVNTYFHDETYWTLGLKTLEQVTAEAPSLTAETRTTSYSYYPGDGLLALETTEPTDSAYTLGKSYGYDAFGNHIRTTISGANIATRSTTHAYDSAGRFLTRTTNALGHFETLVYDPRHGQPTQHTGPNGLVTTWTYDGLGRKNLETRPDATTTTFDYAVCATGCPPQAVTRLTTTTTAKPTSVSHRDQLGREVQTATQGLNGNWIYKTTVYDQLGHAAQISSPYFLGEVPLYTVNEYDALQRVFRATAPGNRVTTTVYNGLTTTVTNPKNQATTIVKDSEGHVLDTIDAAANHTRSSYDAFGNAVQITDPAGNITTMRYDRLGRRLELNDPDRGQWSYVYNVLGLLTEQVDANGMGSTMTYDKLGRMRSRITSEGYSSWTYDTATYGKGKLASQSSPSASETYTYDSLGRLSTDTTSIGGITYTTTTTYDAFSRLLTLTYPVTGFTLYYVYDPYGHLTEVRKDNATGLRYWLAVSADAHGRLTGENLGNGLISQHGYDRATGDLQTINTSTFGGPTVQNSTYTYDALDNLTARTWWDGTAFRTETFGYDPLNRLTAVTGPAAKTYAYYPDGNLQSKSDVGTYTYPTNGIHPHAVTGVTGALNTTYTYDANGNMLTGNGRTIAYTSFNKPKTIDNGDPATLTYDANFNRLVKSNGNGTTIYIGRRYERLDNGSSTVQRHFIYAGNALVGIYTQGSNTRYLHTDHLGSVDTITNETGGVVNRYSYDAHGKGRYANGTDTSIYIFIGGGRRGYTGQEQENEVGLINMNAREYDPLIGRFITPDPLGTQGDPHPYAYANNNPLRYTDPTGTSYVDPFGGFAYSQHTLQYDSSGTFRNDWLQQDMNSYSNAVFQSFDRQMQQSYNAFNSSLSLSVSGGGGLSLTSFNTNYNPGGLSYTNILNTPGAGVPTGTPDFSRMTQPKDNSDLRFTYGLQGSGEFGIKRLFNVNVDVDFGSREYSLIHPGKQYVNESYALTVGVGGYSVGLEASRNRQTYNFRYGVDSIDSYLRNVPFDVKPLFQTPGNMSSSELWKLNFGFSFGLGIEGTLDFDSLRQ